MSLTSLAWMLAALAPIAAEQPSLARFQFRQPHMGTEFVLTFYTTDETTASRAATAAFDRIGQLNARLSDYDPESELSRLSGLSGTGQAVAVSDDLWKVLACSDRLWRASRGAFDVTSGPYVRLWRQARRRRRLPEPSRLAQATESVGFQHVRRDACRRTIELLRPQMRLDLGAIAKGYAGDAALAVLRSHGICAALVDAGGDLAIAAPPPGRPGWNVGVAPLGAGDAPSRVLVLSHCGVATSGDAFQHVVIDDVRYSHLLDPRTGQALTTPSSVTVVARSCMLADGLASAVSVLGPHEGMPLVDRTCGAAAIVVRHEEDRVAKYESARAACLQQRP